MKNKMSKERIIDINKQLGIEFQTEYGLGGNKSNLDYAVSLNEPYYFAREILRGHPFIEGNKRTALMVYLILTTGKSYPEILKDYYDIFQSLAK
jgi:fido (protein-threonine AMPylation protein)